MLGLPHVGQRLMIKSEPRGDISQIHMADVFFFKVPFIVLQHSQASLLGARSLLCILHVIMTVSQHPAAAIAHILLL